MALTRKKKVGRQPPTTKPKTSRETGQPMRKPVSTIKVDHKLIPKLHCIGTEEKRKLISIMTRLTTRRIADEDAEAELKSLLKQVEPAKLNAVAYECVDFMARIALDSRKMAQVLIPQVRNRLK